MTLQFNILGTPARLAEAQELWWLAGAAAAGALLAWAAWKRSRTLGALVPARLVPRAAPGAGSGRGAAAAAMTTLALALAAFALAQPQCGTRTELAKRFGVDVVVALDASASMLARDVQPDRLSRAKLELGHLVDGLQGDRIGVVVFAGEAFVQCPLTTDYAAAKLFLRAVDAGSVPRQGTRLDRAIETARQVFAASDRAARSKVLVLLTDGEDHSGQATSAADKIAEDGVRIFAVGIGSPAGEPIPLVDAQGNVTGYKKDAAGKTVVSRLDESSLRALAERTEGRLLGSVEDVAREIARLEKAEFESRLVVQYADRFQWFVGPALALLVLAALIGRGRWTRAALLAALLAGGQAEARPLSMRVEEPNVSRGNARWKEGRLPDALSDYQAAQAANPQAAEADFDRGDALMRLGKLEEAEGAFQDAARKARGPLKADALYNLGNVHAEAKQTDQAVRAYRDALVANPQHEDARHNLELLLAQKQEEQKRQQRGESQEKKDAQSKEGQSKEQQAGDAKEQQPAQPKRAREDQEADARQLSEQDAEKLLEAMEQSEKALQMWRFNDRERKENADPEDW